MIRRHTIAAAATLTLGAALLAPPAGADPAEATHPPTGGGTADQHSGSMTLEANLPRVDGAVQSDLAFQGDYAYAGSYSGFRVIDISDPEEPEQVSFFPCSGAQGDISVYRDLLFSSVDAPQSKPECDSSSVADAAVPGAWEGVRIFDISDPEEPEHVASVRTDCGSHTNTLVPSGEGDLFVYVSSYALTKSSVGPDCEQFHGKISVIQVPKGAPHRAKVVAEPEIDLSDFDSDRLELDALAPILQDTKGCHDISVLTPRKLAAAACLSEGQLWDISDPTRPVTLRRLDTPQMKTWHSAAFTWDGERMAFGDEWGGGGLPRCRAGDSRESGAVWIYDVASGAPLGSWKVPRDESGTCTMHNFNFVPGVEGDILVASAYTAGTTVADVTDPANPVEIGFYKAGDPVAAVTWSSYWHNGYVYANDITRGLDVFALDHPAVDDAAELGRDNPQTQERLFR